MSARIGSAFSAIRSTCLDVLREIFDESAYRRFLERRQLKPSQASYAAFRHEHEHDKALQARCC